MASTSTISAWMQDLATSLLTPSATTYRQRPKRDVDSFRRRLRHHNFARTNQFDVRDRLDGLEEKFQILNRDDLSDALHERTTELRNHHERWIPDVLDLLLRLSNDPVRKTRLTDLTDVVSSTETPVVLNWADIEGDDPIDRQDPIWQRPSFSDSSSDDDKADVSTATTSPSSAKKLRPQFIELEEAHYDSKIFRRIDLKVAEDQLQAVQKSPTLVAGTATEIQTIRQILLIIQGYPSDLFTMRDGEIQLDDHVHFSTISEQTVQALANEIAPITNNLIAIQDWLQGSTSVDYIQTIKGLVEVITRNFRSSICVLEEQMLQPICVQTTSLLSTIAQIKQTGTPITNLMEYIHQVKDADPISCLDALYEIVCQHYYADNAAGYQAMLPVFLTAFDIYMKPINAWLEHGSCIPQLEPFFISSKGDTTIANSLWRGWYELSLNGRYRPPQFFCEYTHNVFACGKTVAFINHIEKSSNNNNEPSKAATLRNDLKAVLADHAVPFPAAFSDILTNHFSSLLASKTKTLRHLLETSCGMTRTLDAFEYIYLRKDGALLDAIDCRIFNRIDACRDSWNDRFLVADMLEDVYTNIPCIDLDSITVLSASSSSRNIEYRRHSVQILSALAVDYALPWPVANIISKPSMAAYRRISLHLTQIRRAKYILERTAFVLAHSTPIGEDPRDQHLAQTTTFMLVQFVNTIYDHFTTGVTLPLTLRMREELRTAHDVDAMITVHASYIASMEYACLTVKQLKVLRETLIGLLDMCIRFADILSSSSTDANAVSAHRPRKGSDDIETASFFSARSQWKRRRRRHGDHQDEDDEEEDDEDYELDDEGEGYSSFIVLEPDTTVGQEIRKLQVQFKRQLDFFVAGLRGVGRGGGSSVVDEFEILADRLDWKGNA